MALEHALPHLLTGVVLGLAAGASPGPLQTLVVTQTLQYGTREGVKVALAPALTDLPIIALSLAVVLTLAVLEPLLGVISILGGLYVAYLGWSTIKADPGEGSQAAGRAFSVRRGVMINFLSPHPYLFWFVVGAPLLVRVSELSLVAAGLFLLLFYTGLVGTKVLLALMIGRMRGLLRTRWYRLTLRALGLTLLVFAVLLVRDGIGMLWKG